MISTSSLNTGGAKPWPHTSWCKVSTTSGRRYCARQRAVGVQAAQQGGGVQPFLRHLGQRLLRRCPGVPRPRCSPRPWRGRRSAAARRGGAWRPGPARRAGESPGWSGPIPSARCSRPGAWLAAKTKVGRCSLSLMREATMPTTPSWKSGSNTQIAGGGSSPSLEQRFGDRQCLLAHVAFDLAPLAVDARRGCAPVRRRGPGRRSAGIRCPASCRPAGRRH